MYTVAGGERKHGIYSVFSNYFIQPIFLPRYYSQSKEIILSVKKFFLIHNLNLPWCNLRPLLLILALVTWEKRPTPASLQPPFR